MVTCYSSNRKLLQVSARPEGLEAREEAEARHVAKAVVVKQGLGIWINA